MTDEAIMDLYWQRREEAIAATEEKYGGYCRTIARNILADPQDAEECVSDAWLKAWKAMPPRLSLFLGKITRELALNRVKARLAQKRGGGEVPLALEELERTAQYLLEFETMSAEDFALVFDDPAALETRKEETRVQRARKAREDAAKRARLQAEREAESARRLREADEILHGKKEEEPQKPDSPDPF